MPFLSDEYTWEQLSEVRNGDYAFVEEGLSKLSTVIGMDSENILFSAENAIADEQTAFLYFKKGDVKKEKKLTLNAAFNQVFGEALKPLGFKKVKSRYPYYARIINEEIIHVITYISKASSYRGKKAFEIYGGVASVYRENIDFSKKL